MDDDKLAICMSLSETVHFNCIKCSNSFMLLKNTDLYIYFSATAQHWKFSFSLMFSRLHLAAGICSRTTHFILILNLKRKTSIWGQDCLHIAGVWPRMILGNIDWSLKMSQMWLRFVPREQSSSCCYNHLHTTQYHSSHWWGRTWRPAYIFYKLKNIIPIDIPWW